MFTAFVLSVLNLLPNQAAPHAKSPTELEKLVHSRSIDKLRAKFLQAKNHRDRDDCRNALMEVVSAVFQDRSKYNVKKKLSTPLDWPDHEHRGCVDLTCANRKRYHTLYGAGVSKEALEPNKNETPQMLTWNQLIILSGRLDAKLKLSDCVLICDSIEAVSDLSECVVVASSNVKVGSFQRGLIVSNGSIDYHDRPSNALVSRGEIFLVPYNLSAKGYMTKN